LNYIINRISKGSDFCDFNSNFDSIKLPPLFIIFLQVLLLTAQGDPRLIDLLFCGQKHRRTTLWFANRQVSSLTSSNQANHPSRYQHRYSPDQNSDIGFVVA
jgi:hypothetical protein